MAKEQFIKDYHRYDLGKDVYKIHRDVREVHPILMKMVLELDRICRKNKIGYGLSFGSALGLYNYGGIIPWDDDIDIAIDYFDIPRLVEALQKDLSDEFVFDCYETDPRFNVLIPTFKIRYKNSYIKEKYHYTLPNKCGNGDGIFIDIVAFMGVPSDEKEHRKLLKYAKRRMAMYVFADAYLHIQPYKYKTQLKLYESLVANQYKDSDTVSQTVIIPFQDWDEKKHLAWPRDVIYPFREYDFMGHKIYSFNKLEEYCRLCFGEQSLKRLENDEWIDPLPMNKRKAKHNVTYNLFSSSKK